jgi:hypothetical protein
MWSWISVIYSDKKKSSSQMALSHTPPFLLREHRWALANYGFAAVFVASKLAGVCTWGGLLRKAMLQLTQKWAL